MRGAISVMCKSKMMMTGTIPGNVNVYVHI